MAAYNTSKAAGTVAANWNPAGPLAVIEAGLRHTAHLIADLWVYARIKMSNRMGPSRYSDTIIDDLTARRGRRRGESGRVAIVGTGPGDPELLTLRALKLIRRADVVVYDRLVGGEILGHVRRDAARIYVGKSKADHTATQAEINALLAAEARAGKRVVRLKGGDPFVFGRGGEEVQYLQNRGIPVEVVPGITAATGCAAMAGIPLTHRDHASAVTFISGHSRRGLPDLEWPVLARGHQTLVVYMGVSTAGDVARRLIAEGMAPATPAAVIENGTLPQQKVVTGALVDLDDMIARNAITGPAVLVIGEVVGLADRAVAAESPRRAAVGG